MKTAIRSVACLLLFAALRAHSANAAEPPLTAGDASIAHDPQTGTWTLGAGGTTLTLALDPRRDFQVLRLVTGSDQPFTVDTLPDAIETINGTPIVFGNRAAGFVYQRVTAESVVDGTALQLDAAFDLPAAGLRVTRHYELANGSPTFETWNTYEASRAPVALSNLTPFRAVVPAGTLHWLTGLQGDSADTAVGTAFTLLDKTLGINEHFSIGATGRSSERAVPMLAIDGPRDEFYAALMWSGAWTLDVDRHADGLSVTLGLASMTTKVGEDPVDGPHVLFGIVPGGFDRASTALRSYALPGIRDGRRLVPLVTYNTWYAHGTDIDESSIRGEMLRAAALGVELFVVDAGWYAGAGAAGPFDFNSGLGSWEPDPGRFPDGLRPLADYAHSLGMKFGIWVEPERVDLAEIGTVGVDERWLAKSGADYGSPGAAQICFASAAARRFVLEHLISFIETIQADYLKWDNNMWINCDRPGHDHGPTDGNFGHVKGLYDILEKLRARFPHLIIENVSGGGNRLDLGMLQFTDVAWMSDRTSPSVQVRHNLQGLSAVFPPAYLLSFVIDDRDEPLHRASDMSLYFRSRMQGAIGLSFRNEAFSDAELGMMAAEIDIYKAIRATLSTASASLLSLQATPTDGPAWDVLQETADGGEHLLLSVVRSDIGVDRVTVRPVGLHPTTNYEVRSVDEGVLGTAAGSELMESGIEVVNASLSAAHTLLLTAKP